MSGASGEAWTGTNAALTADDACALLKVKKSWLYDTVEAGAIEVIRLGKQLRFQPSAISAYLAERARSQKARLK
jgi:excisionase family DNA binding protein